MLLDQRHIKVVNPFLDSSFVKNEVFETSSSKNIHVNILTFVWKFSMTVYKSFLIQFVKYSEISNIFFSLFFRLKDKIFDFKRRNF